ncbi:hypothetical protein BH24ACT5_BH24ACT5_24770 [soil metagenome]
MAVILGLVSPAVAPTPTVAPMPAVRSCVVTGGVTHAWSVPYATADGVDPELLSLDLAVPAVGEGCAPPPLVVFVHCGGWRRGDKANGGDAAARLFNGAGLAYASVNYRLSPAVQYPTHDDDVATALDWLSDHAADYGFDPTHVRLYGFSAGATIVASLATNETHLASVGRDIYVLGCVAALDTEGYDVAAAAAETGSLGALYRDAFGDDPATWAEASPINHVAAGAGTPPMLLVTRGGPDRTALTHRFAELLIAAGVDTRVVEVPDLRHDQVNAAIGDPDDVRISPALLSLFDDCTF